MKSILLVIFILIIIGMATIAYMVLKIINKVKDALDD